MTVAYPVGGSKASWGSRVDADTRMRHDRELSERHYAWGQNCPAVDLDFLMCEFNRGIPVVLVDYKWQGAPLGNTNGFTFKALSGLYNEHGDQLPFFVARYWPDVWAFKVLPMNAPAQAWLQADTWVPMTEKEWVTGLYRMRKVALNKGDCASIARLNTELPPDGSG
jgi:hypothetical protein